MEQGAGVRDGLARDQRVVNLARLGAFCLHQNESKEDQPPLLTKSRLNWQQPRNPQLLRVQAYRPWHRLYLRTTGAQSSSTTARRCRRALDAPRGMAIQALSRSPKPVRSE